jgi:hypothetical protein
MNQDISAFFTPDARDFSKSKDLLEELGITPLRSSIVACERDTQLQADTPLNRRAVAHSGDHRTRRRPSDLGGSLRGELTHLRLVGCGDVGGHCGGDDDRVRRLGEQVEPPVAVEQGEGVPFAHLLALRAFAHAEINAVINRDRVRPEELPPLHLDLQGAVLFRPYAHERCP